MEQLLQDTRHSIRMFLGNPGFTIVAVAAAYLQAYSFVINVQNEAHMLSGWQVLSRFVVQ